MIIDNSSAVLTGLKSRENTFEGVICTGPVRISRKKKTTRPDNKSPKNKIVLLLKESFIWRI
jgi:hypothetical protein